MTGNKKKTIFVIQHDELSARKVRTRRVMTSAVHLHHFRFRNTKYEALDFVSWGVEFR